jgi:predicted Rdx family selenoprotein
MLPKVRRSAQGCSTCKIVLQTKKSAQKVLSAIGKGLSMCVCRGGGGGMFVCSLESFLLSRCSQKRFHYVPSLAKLAHSLVPYDLFLCMFQLQTMPCSLKRLGSETLHINDNSCIFFV